MSGIYIEKRMAWRIVDGRTILVQIEKSKYAPKVQERRDEQASALEMRLARATKWAQGEGVLEALTVTLEKGFNAAGIAPGLNPFRSAGIDVDPRVVIAVMDATVHASRVLRKRYLGAGFTEVREQIGELLSPYVDGTPDIGKLHRRRMRKRR